MWQRSSRNGFISTLKYLIPSDFFCTLMGNECMHVLPSGAPKCTLQNSLLGIPRIIFSLRVGIGVSLVTNSSFHDVTAHPELATEACVACRQWSYLCHFHWFVIDHDYHFSIIFVCISFEAFQFHQPNGMGVYTEALGTHVVLPRQEKIQIYSAKVNVKSIWSV